MSRRLVSVVVPCLNEEHNVAPLYERLRATLVTAGVDYEVIFSLDPCTDATEERIREIRVLDPRVKMLRLSRRFGQPAATLAGLRMASGDACVVIDCDLQDPPELIGEMIERWSEGFDVVYAQRRSRAGETVPKRIVAALGYRVIRRVAEVEIPPNTGDFRLMSRRVVDEVLRLNETHGFLRGLVALVGFPQTSVLYDRDPRATGTTNYNRFTGSIRIGLNGIIGFSRYPLQIITIIGLVTFVFAMVLALVYLGLKLGGVDIAWGNPTLVMIISFFSGIQLLSLGVIGEYVGRIYDEVKRRPIFVVDVLEGFQRPLATFEGDDQALPAPGRPQRRAVSPSAAVPPVAILAGGLGTRLGALAAGCPKGMVRVAGRPFLEHVLERLARHGVTRVIICRGHLGGVIELGLGDGRRYGLSIGYSDEGTEPIGTASALRLALPLLGERFLVMYGDTYLRVDYGAVADAHVRSGREALMTVLRNRGRWGTSNVDYARGRVRAYDNRTPPAGAEWIDYGLLAMTPGAMAGDEPALTEVLRALAARGELAGMAVRARFYEIGTPEALAETERHLARRRPAG